MIKYFRLALYLSILAGIIFPQSLLLAQTEPDNAKNGVETSISAKLVAETKRDEGTADGGADTELTSLLLSDSDIASIRSARTYYEQHLNGKNNGIAEDDFLKNLEKMSNMQETEPKTFTYPQFYLASIAYRSANDWVVWINDEKITQESGVSADGLRIVQIDSGKVTVEWKPQRMDKIADIASSGNDAVKVDFLNNKVTFSLKANQTFTSYAMRVVEGKVPPMTVDISNSSPAAILDNAKPVGNK